MLSAMLVGRPGLAEVVLILAVLLIPAAVVAFIVWVGRRAHRAPDEGGT